MLALMHAWSSDYGGRRKDGKHSGKSGASFRRSLRWGMRVPWSHVKSWRRSGSWSDVRNMRSCNVPDVWKRSIWFMNDAEGFGMPYFLTSPEKVVANTCSLLHHLVFGARRPNRDYYQLSRRITRDDDLTGASNRLFHHPICRSSIRSTQSPAPSDKSTLAAVSRCCNTRSPFVGPASIHIPAGVWRWLQQWPVRVVI